MISNSSKTQWGKLTSLNPNFCNLSLSKNPSPLLFAFSPLQENNDQNSDEKCQIYQDKQEFFISYNGENLVVLVNNKVTKEGKAFKVHSGDVIKVTIKKKRHEITLEYIFSSELIQEQRETLKRDREENEVSSIAEKKIKFQEEFKNEAICNICCKMIYECVSVVPCLHSFCTICFMRHLKRSQECPQCGERFVEFRKNIFLNNLIEGYKESGYGIDRSREECRKLKKKLKKRILARFEYANGDVYVGKWKKCRKDGEGKMIFWNGEVEEGCWKNGLKEGKGKFRFSNGSLYEGDFKGAKREGKGKMIFSDGDIYEGEWKNDKQEGQGKYIWKDGSVYEGGWREDKMNGEGKFWYPSGSIWEGSVRNGIIEGKGKTKYINGDVYEGDWENNLKQGKGIMIYKNGDFYEGEWRFDMRHGKGKIIYINGDVYEGEWRYGMRSGKGKMIYTNGDIYEGEWEYGLRSGKGKMIYTNGDVYDGYWRNHEKEDRKPETSLCVRKWAKKNKKRKSKRNQRNKKKNFE